jgi:hypothetical protein
MNTTLNKIAAVLAFVIGAMAVFAGGQVLLGSDPGYYVIDWLPVYNYTLGVITVFTTAALVWINSRFAFPAALATLGIHILVMVILQIAYRDVVAMDSIVAMTIRMTVWLIILGLMFFARRNKEVLHA